uniref:Hedgehog protein n=1 Tax=Acanthochitona crinita TaxID=126420 RepID=A0A1J0M5P1_ACACN|nr:hedgehog [Acanthochitona crinita]
MAGVCGIALQCLHISVVILLVVCGPTLQCGPGRAPGRRPPSRKRTPLVFQQHVPSVSENTLGASGPPEGKITRNDERFKDLAENFNPDIIFKDHEGSGADRRMSHRCKDKLNTLAIAVMNQWPGVKLRVVEAWDEDGIHEKNSLHYEGRAVDITTSDRDRSKYGLLARLAVEAGFDWVYYESRRHIHCSVASDSSAVVKIGGCFPGQGLVLSEREGWKTMASLGVGERVLSVDSHGRRVFSPVLSFLHKDSSEQVLFYTLHLEDKKITLTGKHLIFIHSENSTRNLATNNYRAVFAEKVVEGDFVYVIDSENHNSRPSPSRVTHVSVETLRGVYAPLTATGTIVVDGVVASCYAYTENVALAHFGFAPMRLLHDISSYLPFDLWTQKSPADGFHWYARILYSLGEIVLSDDVLYSPFSH